MKDFDEQRALREQGDRSFKLGGETFVRRASVRPEATSPWEDISVESPSAVTLAAIDETICNLIEPGDKGEAHKRWKALRKREEDPVSLADLLALVQWLIEEMAGRPTEQPPNSSDELGGNGTRSTDASSSAVSAAVSTP